jgi:hypothetical protein
MRKTQPWRFRVGDSLVEFYLETGRRVRGLDPYLREAHIGMGCALENFLLCAAASGFATAVSHVEGALGAQSSVSPMQMVARVYGRVHAFFVNAELYR